LPARGDAALLDPAKGQPAPPPRHNNRHLYTDASPLDAVPFEAGARRDRRGRARARSARGAGLPVVGLVVGGRVVRADGFAHDVRPLVRLNVSVVVEDNGRRETGSFGIGAAPAL
jgi:TldD protein